jgi:WD40 repeat protein
VLEGHLNSNWGTLKAKFAPDGKSVAAGSEDGCLNIWDENGELKKHYLHSSCVWEISFSRTTQSIVTCSEDSSVCVLRLNNEDLEHKYQSPKKSPKRKTALKKDVLCRFRDSCYYHASIIQRHKDNTYCKDNQIC